MRVIHKFIFTGTHLSVTVPLGSKPLCVKLQNGSPVMWILKSNEPISEVREFIIVGTGHPIPDRLNIEYIDTVLDGPMVWHILEVKS